MNCSITFDGNTKLTFSKNEAKHGGAVNSYSIKFCGNSKVTFNDNVAKFGGVIFSRLYSQISYDDITMVMHTSNNGGGSGGAVSLIDYCSIWFHWWTL